MIYQSDTLYVRYIDEGIAELCFDREQARINMFDRLTLASLESAIHRLEDEERLKGLLISTAKESFIVGADIGEFTQLFAQPSAEIKAWLDRANLIFNALEDLCVPTISAIDGAALGGGLECALATDFRVAAPSAQIGFPETKLGIMPGFGGTVRLPRLIGVDNALEWITTGSNHTATAAQQIGVLDAVVEPEQLGQAALSMLTAAIEGKLDWQSRREIKSNPIQLNQLEAEICFATAKTKVSTQVGPHYPAPLTAVKTLEKAAKSHRNEALQIESTHFIELAKSPSCQALVGAFLNEQVVKHRYKKQIQPKENILRATILDADDMGRSLAFQSACHGIHITLLNADKSELDLCLHEAASDLNRQLKQGRINGLKMAQVLGLITPQAPSNFQEPAEIIIDTKAEDIEEKAKVLADIENSAATNCLIATTSSTTPVYLLANRLKRPENLCGIHFTLPLHQNRLVEIIRGEQTSDAAISRALTYTAKLGKTAIVVNDCPGFFINRVLFSYLLAFNQLVTDGADFSQIDQVMESDFGWPVGPAQLLDTMGIDTSMHILTTLTAAYPHQMATMGGTNIIQTLVTAGHYGQKTGVGFYQYQCDRKGRVIKQKSTETLKLIAQQTPPATSFSRQTIIDRMMIPMVNEAVRCLEEGIIDSPAEADMALLYGLDFPAFRGGLFRYLEMTGLAKFIATAEQMAHLGPLYQVTGELQSKAAADERYYA